MLGVCAETGLLGGGHQGLVEKDFQRLRLVMALRIKLKTKRTLAF